MRTLVKSAGILCFVSIWLAAPTSALAGADGSPTSTPGGGAAFVLRPGVIVDASRPVVFLMRPGGGIDAMEVRSGRVLWHSAEAAKPLAVSGDLLVAVADRAPAGAAAALDVVLLGAADGRRRQSARVALPPGTWTAVDDGPGRSLQVAATIEAGGVFVSWAAEDEGLTGVAPGTTGPRPAAKALKAGGVVRIDAASGRVEALPLGAAEAERRARVETVAETVLPKVEGDQYVSADGRHLLASVRVADDRVWEKYRWTIYSLPDGARVGEVSNAFPQAPFFVAGTHLVFEARPFVRQVDGALVEEPLKLRSVDLSAGGEAWSAPLRDTVFHGPFPESLEAAAEDEVMAALPAPAARAMVAAFEGTWRAIGPAPKRGGATPGNPPTDETVGAIHTILPHPTNANILYAGTVNGGIWRTMNAAAARPNWMQLTDPQVSLSIGALDFDPLDTTMQTLVAGIGRFSSFGRRGGARTGLLRSTDGGATWIAIGAGLAGKNISAVAVRGQRIVVAVNAADNAGTGTDAFGIFRSTNGGVTFTQISSGNGAATGLPFGVTHDVVRDPANSSRLFTGVFRADESGGQNGVYRSTNGGAAWTKVSSAEMDALAVAGAAGNTEFNMEFAIGRNNVIFALIVNNTSGRGRLAGLFRSANGGGTWTAMDVPGTNPIGQGALHLSEAVDPADGNIVYIAGDTAMFRCNAGLARGSQCTTLRGSGTANNTGPHVDSREMAFDAAGNLIECDDGGVFRRTSPQNNQGDWFSIGNNIQGFEEHSTAYDPNANVAMGGFQDNGVGRELVPNQAAWQNVNGGDGGDVAVDAISTPGLSSRYSSSQNLGGFRRQVFNANNVFQSQVQPALALVGGGAAPTFQFVTPVRVNTVDGRRLVIGASNGVYESFDQGETIRLVLPAVPVNGGGGHTLAYGAEGNPNILYVASSDGVRVRTGAPPAALVASTSYPGTGSGRPVVDLAVDPSDPNTAFAIDNANVFVTRDAGATWTNITGNLLTLAPGGLRSVVHVRNASGEVVAVGTNHGVFAALASGGFSGWALLGSGFPHAMAWDLEYVRARDLLVAGTLGRGTWVMQPSFRSAEAKIR